MKKVFVILLGLLLCFMGCAQEPSAEAPESLRVAYFPNLTHAQALYGKNTGRFAEAFGVDLPIEWVEFNAGPSEIEAMFAGEVDIGYIGPIPAINGNSRSQGDIQILVNATNAGAIFVTRPDLILTSPAELSGLKVAIPQLGNTQHISLLHILRENGLETTEKGGTVEVVASANADTKTLLDRGEIDAALVPEPWGARLVHEIGANIFMDEKAVWKDGNYPVALVIVNMDFAKAHPDILDTFLATHKAITAEINADTDAAKDIINKELLALTGAALDPNVMDEAFSRIIVTDAVELTTLEEFRALMAAEGLAEETGGDYSLIME